MAPATTPIRVLVAEDSAVQRALLLDILGREACFDVVGTAADGVEAVERTERLRPDIVLMDCHMPRINGIEATREIMRRCPTPIVIVSATLAPEELNHTFDAIRTGALAVLMKPAAPTHPRHDRDAAELVQTLRLMSEVKVVGRRGGRSRTGAALPPPGREAPPLHALAIAGSTGAPGVIAGILADLPRPLPVPVLIVQHMAAGFLEGFAGWLGQRSLMPAAIAQHGVRAAPGTIHVAPDGKQMALDRYGRIALADGEPVDGFCPSATYLFRSLAHARGPGTLGVLLTGMGRDGAAGLRDLRAAGGVTAVQDEASCAVFGMPAEAIRLGAAMHVLPPRGLADLIALHASLRRSEFDAAR